MASAYVKSAEARRNMNDWNGAYNDASQSLLSVPRWILR